VRESVYWQVIQGAADANTRFGDPRSLLVALGFNERIKSHHIFARQGVAGIWYYLSVRELWIGRAFVAFGCIALLLWCTAIAPTAADPQFAIPALVFCFLAILRLSRLRLSDGNSAAQPISFLTVHVSRAPPLA
jgi:hypothetical protein